MKFSVLSATVLIAVSSAAYAETMPGEALLLLDVDGNKSVSITEFSEQMGKLFGGMDTNQNGHLERREVEGFMSKDIFDNADMNRSGGISRSEYDTQIRKDFEGADRNGDGSLN